MEEMCSWYVGEEPTATNQFPRMNDKCLALIARAVINLRGSWLSTYVDCGYPSTSNKDTFVAHISLPKSAKAKFEEITGYPLTVPPAGCGQSGNNSGIGGAAFVN